MNKLFQLSFIPRSTNFGLLVLRLWLGLTLLFNHGLGKLVHHAVWSGRLPDVLHVGAHLNLALIVFAEVVCAALVAVGVATRLAALVIVIEMAVAFFGVHHGALAMGPGSGELPFLYLGGFLTIVLAGGGCCSACCGKGTCADGTPTTTPAPTA